jgi:hypothetical protein
MIDPLVSTKISEAAGKLFDHPLAAIDISQQQTTRIGSDVATLKINYNFSASKLLK